MTKYRNFNIPTDTYNGRVARNFFYFLGLGLAFIMCVMLTIRLYVYNDTPKGKAVTPHIHMKYRWQDKTEKIFLNKLIPILKDREGLRLKPYKADGHQYIGYGHLILSFEEFIIPIDSIEADNLLIKDINQAFNEYLRIHEKEIVKDCYQIFISGKPTLCKR